MKSDVMHSKCVNVLFPQRGNQVWVCVSRSVVRQSPNTKARVVGQMQVKQYIFEVSRVKNRFGRTWIAFIPPNSHFMNLSRYGDYCWVPVNTSVWMPILERVEDHFTKVGQIFKLDKILLNLNMLNEFCKDHFIHRFSSQNNVGQGIAAHDVDKARNKNGNKTIDIVPAKITSVTPTKKKADINDASLVDRPEYEDGKKSNVHILEIPSEKNVLEIHTGMHWSAHGVKVNSICRGIQTIVMTILCQANVPAYFGDSFSHGARKREISDEVHDQKSRKNVFFDTIDISDYSNLLHAIRVPSVCKMWARMDIVNQLQYCLRKRASQHFAFSTYIKAACNSGARLMLDPLTLYEWIIHYLQDHPTLVHLVPEIKALLRHQSLYWSQSMPLPLPFPDQQYLSHSHLLSPRGAELLPLLECLYHTGQTLAHQKVIFNIVSQGPGWAKPESSLLSPHSPSHSDDNTSSKKKHSEPNDSKNYSKQQFLHLQKSSKISRFKKWFGNAAAAAVNSILRFGNGISTVGVTDILTDNVRLALAPIVQLLHKMYALPQFTLHRIYNLRLRLFLVRNASLCFALVPPISDLMHNINMSKKHDDSASHKQVSLNQMHTLSPEKQNEDGYNSKCVENIDGLSVKVMLYLKTRHKPAQISEILAIYDSDLQHKIHQIDVRLKQCGYLSEINRTQATYFKDIVLRDLPSTIIPTNLTRLLDKRSRLHARCVKHLDKAYHAAHDCLNRRRVVVGMFVNSEVHQRADQAIQEKNTTGAHLQLLQVLQCCTEPGHVLAQDALLVKSITDWEDVQQELQTLNGDIKHLIDIIFKNFTTGSMVNSLRSHVKQIGKSCSHILNEVATNCPTLVRKTSSEDSHIPASSSIVENTPSLPFFLHPQWSKSASQFFEICADRTTSIGAFVQGILIPEVHKRLYRIKKYNEIEEEKMNPHHRPRARSGGGSGLPGRPHALIWANSKPKAYISNSSKHNSPNKSKSDKEKTSSKFQEEDEEEKKKEKEKAEVIRRDLQKQQENRELQWQHSPQQFNNHDLPLPASSSSTKYYKKEMNNVLRLIRRCSACLAHEVFWICVGNNGDIEELPIFRDEDEPGHFKYVLKYVFYFLADSYVCSEFFADIVLTFLPHPCVLHHHVAADALPTFAALNARFAEQCHTLMRCHTLQEIGMSDEMALIFGHSSVESTYIIDAASGWMFSRARNILTAMLTVRGYIAMKESLVALIEALVNDISCAGHGEPHDVGAEQMFPALLFVLVSGPSQTKDVHRQDLHDKIVPWIQVMTIAAELHDVDNKALQLDGTDMHGFTSFALATVHAAIKWIVEFSGEKNEDGSSTQ